MDTKLYKPKKALSSTTKILLACGIATCAVLVFAAPPKVATIGTLADNIKKTFSAIAQTMMGMSYVAGIGFFIGAIFKFKQHKDNPTQIPMGTPIALLMIAVCLVFMPYIIKVSGATLTGGDKGSFGTASPTALPGAAK